MKRFGVMLDMSRNAVMKPEQVKKIATILKSFGYNMIQLYTEDTYEVENEPYFGYMRGRYSTEELKDIVSYCNAIDMEVIPCIQTLAHLNQIFRWAPYNGINDYDDILLAEEPRTYELIENMFKSLRKSFTTEYVHIGMDEAHMLGLGRYLDKHGVKNRFDILHDHLEKVIEIAKKYGFKPLMWSDMFFRLANKGEYYPPEPTFNEEVKASIPENVGLVYWDYYHESQEYYEKMMRAHQMSGNDVWFAGGAWVWTGFAPNNTHTMDTMQPAMLAAKNCNLENIFITMWGDDGAECSFYSVLPSLFAIRKFYDGETDIEKIKAEFKEITGEDYDAMFNLDRINLGCDGKVKTLCKHMLYSDPFNGFLDSTVKEGVAKEYAEQANYFHKCAKNSSFSYLFENAATLCEVLAVKYDLGARTRVAYQKGDKNQLSALVADYEKCIELIEKFHEVFQKLWYEYNKPHGFDVQDIRLGGLIQRLKSCKKILNSYIDGNIVDIPELEEELLDYYGNGKEFKQTEPVYNTWRSNASVNIV